MAALEALPSTLAGSASGSGADTHTHTFITHFHQLLVRTLVSQKAFKPDEIISDSTRLVQDMLHYCNATNTPGFLLFADQDSAYPRVRWDYMIDVMREMNFPPFRSWR